MKSQTPHRNLVKLSLVAFSIVLFSAMASSSTPPASATGVWSDGKAADVVLGQGGFGTSLNPSPPTPSSLDFPEGVAVDPTTGKLFVADSSNHRILRFASAGAWTNGQPAESELGQVDFLHGLANRIGGVSPPAAANTLNWPIHLYVDSAGRLWVADMLNHRVLRFDNASAKGMGANADGVLGQADFVHGDANRIASSPYFPPAANTMYMPVGVWVDNAGRLWVSEIANCRVLRFDNAATKSNGAPADRVLGQPAFNTWAPATTQNGMNSPGGIILTGSGALFVADGANHRVLRFDSAAAKPDGANADGVLGQSGFELKANPSPPNAASMNIPTAVAYEENGGRLFVADRANNRVLIFSAAVTKANGANAEHVLGQTTLLTGGANSGGISATTQSNPVSIFFDNAANVLWLADSQNYRVLRYSPAASTTTTAVTSSANPSTFGWPVTFTATVALTLGTGAPTGTVQFSEDGNNLGAPVPLAGGVATLTTSALSIGSHAIVAVYIPSAGFSSSAGTLSGGQRVNLPFFLPLLRR